MGQFGPIDSLAFLNIKYSSVTQLLTWEFFLLHDGDWPNLPSVVLKKLYFHHTWPECLVSSLWSNTYASLLHKFKLRIRERLYAALNCACEFGLRLLLLNMQTSAIRPHAYRMGGSEPRTSEERLIREEAQKEEDFASILQTTESF